MQFRPCVEYTVMYSLAAVFRGNGSWAGVNIGLNWRKMCAGKEAAAGSAVRSGWTAASSAGDSAEPARTKGSGK